MRRPDVFTLDYSHPLAQGLQFAMLGGQAGASSFFADSLDRGVCSAVGGAKWAADIGRYVISLDGSDDHVVLPEIDSTGVKTLSFLCYPENVSSTRHPIQICSNQNDRISVGYVSSGVTYVSQRASSSYTKQFNIGAANEWKSISIRKDASNISDIYLNGVDVTSPGANFWADPLLVSYIGRRTSGSYFDGLIGDVLVHNRALSPSEIALLADRTDPMLGGLVREVNPVAYFDFGASAPTDITGTMSATESGTDTFAAAGKLLISGLMSVNEPGTDAAAASGSVPIQGTITATETGSDTFVAYGGAIAPITGTMAITESGHDAATIIGQLLISGLMSASEVGCDVFDAIGVVTDTAPITAAEVARTVSATLRMKTVTASERVKQVRYEIARA